MLRGRTRSILGIVGLTVLVRYLHFYLQRNIVYSPRKYTVDDEKTILEKYGLPPSCAIDIVAKDKTSLRAYWIPIEQDEGSSLYPTILYLHGNTGKIEWGLSSSVKWQRHMKVNFFILSYRGFGLSEGHPTAEGIKLDSQAALDYLMSREDIDKENIILYGHSLGGAVALHLAENNSLSSSSISAVILENTFISLAHAIIKSKEVTHMFGPFIEKINEIGNLWNNQAKITQLINRKHQQEYKVPHILILAGEDDARIPHWHSQSLWNIIKSSVNTNNCTSEFHSHIHIFPKSLHSCHTHPDYYKVISRFIEKIMYKKVAVE